MPQTLRFHIAAAALAALALASVPAPVHADALIVDEVTAELVQFY